MYNMLCIPDSKKKHVGELPTIYIQYILLEWAEYI